MKTNTLALVSEQVGFGAPVEYIELLLQYFGQSERIPLESEEGESILEIIDNRDSWLVYLSRQNGWYGAYVPKEYGVEDMSGLRCPEDGGVWQGADSEEDERNIVATVAAAIENACVTHGLWWSFG